MANLFGKKLRPKLSKTVVPAWNDDIIYVIKVVSIYSEMI